MMDPPSTELMTHIKHLYHTYRHTPSADGKGQFISPTCLQICRPKPSFAATTRGEIIQYLKDAQQGIINEDGLSSETLKPQDTTAKDGENQKSGKGVYTIRPLENSEHEFSTDEITRPIKLTVKDLEQKSKQENWIGVRVDIWNQSGSEGGFHGRLFKVQYWYRRENVPENERLKGEEDGFGWRQCFHDIMYMDQKDGTEGEAGLEVLE